MTVRDRLAAVVPPDLVEEVEAIVEECVRAAMTVGVCATPGCGGPILINPRGGSPRKFCTTCSPPIGSRRPRPTACEVCGAPIEQASNGLRRYCPDCRRANRNAITRARRRAAWAPIHCRHCGEEIKLDEAGRNRRYCSDEHKVAARRARERRT